MESTTKGSSSTASATHLAIVATATLSSVYVIQNLLRKYDTRKKLRLMAEEAVQRRDEKVHKVLEIIASKTLQDDDDSHDDACCYSALETREGIIRGNISAVDNIIHSVRRCVLYGRKDGQGVNAITEEFYDEVRTCVSTDN